MPGVSADFSQWRQESLPNTSMIGSFSDHTAPVWSYDATSATVGSANGAPSIFCSDVVAPGNHMEGKMMIQPASADDDYFGFVLGYSPGDFTNPGGEYYVLDWKRKGQLLGSSYNPCGGTSMTVPKGLAASKATGAVVESELWAHADYTCAASIGGVEELTRGSTLADIGWVENKEYDFCLEVTETSIKLTIDEVKEIEIAVPVDSSTPFCFYTFSQDYPKWYDVTIAPLSDHGCDGDPHFKTWTDEHFEYHGQCDLVLAKDPDFADGLGMDVHIRTKVVRYWSYIKSAAIRIGNDILEIEGSATEFDSETHYWFNFDYQGELTEFAGFPVKIFAQQGTRVHKNRIEIDLSSKYPGQKIVLSTFKEFVKVQFENSSAEAYGNTVGMLGDYKTGKTLARDGVTGLHDFTDYGHEWQVLPSDGMLFREVSHPQFPEPCIDPEDPRGQRQRRLDESTVSIEDAEAACASLKDELDRKDCVYDIIATQDMDMAGAY
eukprot:CAMPEP_0113614296 /NCGR_PEP_ID=MMETSP0017_2-20120614/7090_1 /TAXON_ID=2856 /ORGANISM="Cylindrotheca closterium" /LENGTH=491 /DNA_ID=CAMNT_0000523453 /DNA_START=57 /DNA_END=1532 /DNA_ORIENTATION=- /assembly_acc=CAM_ASM_000147